MQNLESDHGADQAGKSQAGPTLLFVHCIVRSKAKSNAKEGGKRRGKKERSEFWQRPQKASRFTLTHTHTLADASTYVYLLETEHI